QAPAIAGDLVEPGETILLVTPIDAAAPKGRLILPQVQTIRDILDHDCQCVVCKETGLKKILEKLKTPPALVVTDSQVFGKVAALVPPEIPLTSFSILMARYKGDLAALVQGAEAVASLKPGDRVLIGEACTHRCLADDIGRVKIPRWLEQAVGGSLKIDHASGYGFPEELEKYKLVVHCGGCMLNRREMLHRIRAVTSEGIPIVNYGVLIAYLHGILPRALAPFQGKEKIYEVL
ncbi:MAG TPA: [FeFe] hydrogenase H-cluster maturation GTPase HydF, partial [Firmicutes bacterium]|nr:[FeFe] hydrogenase H-cluster maturation GTPase HydF [Bacillota bacterium]